MAGFFIPTFGANPPPPRQRDLAAAPALDGRHVVIAGTPYSRTNFQDIVHRALDLGPLTKPTLLDLFPMQWPRLEELAIRPLLRGRRIARVECSFLPGFHSANWLFLRYDPRVERIDPKEVFARYNR